MIVAQRSGVVAWDSFTDAVRTFAGVFETNHEVRIDVRASATGPTVAASLQADVLRIVHEACSNAVRHGAPPVQLTLWGSAERVVCTISDRGPGMADPFAGYGPAHGNDLSRGGMGLWLARQLCDHVDITMAGDGVRVRLTTDLP